MGSSPAAVEHMIVIGDFNCNWLDDNTSKLIKTHAPIIAKFTQHITEPTTYYGTTIDHIYTNFSNPHLITGVLPAYYTDHHLIYIALDPRT